MRYIRKILIDTGCLSIKRLQRTITCTMPSLMVIMVYILHGGIRIFDTEFKDYHKTYDAIHERVKQSQPAQQPVSGTQGYEMGLEAGNG